ncbi:hypothetical protein E4U17_004912 [Claviceps sp. LM77 group G4]|nr:hypothetical protein E4U17_004912 [Claviceps sp. LM77 group G4]KAG6083791.1 hypothetical protein E4U33_004364 [Claviceps sp. LM78 group G4]
MHQASPSPLHPAKSTPSDGVDVVIKGNCVDIPRSSLRSCALEKSQDHGFSTHVDCVMDLVISRRTGVESKSRQTRSFQQGHTETRRKLEQREYAVMEKKKE